MTVGDPGRSGSLQVGPPRGGSLFSARSALSFFLDLKLTPKAGPHKVPVDLGPSGSPGQTSFRCISVHIYGAQRLLHNFHFLQNCFRVKMEIFSRTFFCTPSEVKVCHFPFSLDPETSSDPGPWRSLDDIHFILLTAPTPPAAVPP